MMRLLIEAAVVAIALVVGYLIGQRRADRSLRLPFGADDRIGRKTIAR